MKVENLSRVVTFLPKSKIKAGEAKENGKYVFFTSSDSTHLYIDEYLYDDELIVLGTGGFPSCNYYNGKFAVSTDNFVIKTNNNLLPKYLYYFLRKDNLSMLRNGFRGTGLKHISKDYVSNIQIPIIDLKDQKTMVGVLDKLNNSIEGEKQLIVCYDKLIKSRFNEMFGDPIKNEKKYKTVPLSLLAPFNTVRNATPISEHTWLLNLDMVESNTGRVISKMRTSKVDGSTCEFDTACVLYSKLRPYLNKVVVPDEAGFCTSEMIVLRCNPESINRYFLASLLRHQSFVDYINSKTAGSKMPRASMDILRKFPVLLPDIQSQDAFASFVEKVDKLKFNCQQRIKLYQELLDKKMDEYFG